MDLLELLLLDLLVGGLNLAEGNEFLEECCVVSLAALVLPLDLLVHLDLTV